MAEFSWTEYNAEYTVWNDLPLDIGPTYDNDGPGLVPVRPKHRVYRDSRVLHQYDLANTYTQFAGLVARFEIHDWRELKNVTPKKETNGRQ